MTITSPTPTTFEKADPENLASLFQHLRVVDVVDALDGIDRKSVV